ncbi:MAG TPA: Ig-like domain-containing protein, partial [Longimicrobiales bacterium]|nr:Ig-like domain-containing protein [Longimicrobiales bacterium]
MSAACLSRSAAVCLAAVLFAVSCTDVSVNTVLVDRVEVDPRAATIAINGSVRLTARVLSETGQVLTGRSVAWTSLNPSVASVDGVGNVSGLAAGAAVVRATSEGISADATITVTSAPLLAVSPDEVAFAGVQNGSTPGDRTVSVTNAGTGTLTGLSAAVTYGAGQPTGWLSASLSGTTAPASLMLSANQAGLGPGTYTATVAVASPV